MSSASRDEPLLVGTALQEPGFVSTSHWWRQVQLDRRTGSGGPGALLAGLPGRERRAACRNGFRREYAGLRPGGAHAGIATAGSSAAGRPGCDAAAGGEVPCGRPIAAAARVVVIAIAENSATSRTVKRSAGSGDPDPGAISQQPIC